MGLDVYARLLFGIQMAFEDVMYKAPRQHTCGRGHWYEDLPGGSFCPRCGGQLETKQPWMAKPEIIAVWPEIEKDGVLGWQGRAGVRFHEASQAVSGMRQIPCPLLLGKLVLETRSHKADPAVLGEPRMFYPGTDVIEKMRSEIRDVVRPLGWEVKATGFLLQAYLSS